MGKKVNLTNVEIINLMQGCNLIQSKFDLIASLDFRMTKIINTIQPHVKEYQEAIDKIKEKYRKKDDDDSDKPKVKGDDSKSDFEVEEGKEDEYKKEIEKLDDEKVEFQLPTTFHIEDFVDEDGKQLRFKEENLGGVTYLIDPIIVV